MSKIVIYARVSTSSQGESGLGLAAQLKELRAFAKAAEHEIVQPEFIEIQSGADEDRPVLAEAVRTARLYGAALVVAKADRLTRTGETVQQVEKRLRVKITCLDNLSGDDLKAMCDAFIGSMERALIKRRTKAALAALRASGKRLGGYRGTPPKAYAQTMAVAAVKARANDTAKGVAGEIAKIDPDGTMSLRALAAALTAQGVVTPRGGDQWTATQVARIKAKAIGA